MAHFAASVSFDGLQTEDTVEVHFHGFLTAPAHPAGHSDDAEGDAWVAAAVYRSRGTEFQRHLQGEFCIAIVDRRIRQVVLTHDGLGLRPLYYAVTGRTIHFGSRIEAVAQAAGADDLDDAFVMSYLRDGAPHAERTVFAGIRRIPIGTTVVWDGSSLKVLSTWDVSEVEALRYRSDEEYDEHFRSLLSDAIRKRMGRATWAELSGGLDSSSILAVASDAGLSPLDAVSYLYPGSPTADERRWITPVLDRCGVPWHPLDIDGASAPFAATPDRRLGQPSRALVMWGQFDALERAAVGGGTDVVLSGFGGDQVLAGDLTVPPHLADLVSVGGAGPLIRELRAWQHADATRRPLRYYLVRLALQPAYRHHRGLDPRGPGPTDPAPWLSREFTTRVSVGAPHRHPKPTTGVARTFFRDQLTRTASAIPELWNGLTDQFDIRYPLLDRSLVEFMASVPWDQKLRPGEDRVLQRRALNHVLPPETRCRTDKAGPDEPILRGFVRQPELEDLLTRAPEIVRRGYVDAPAWTAAVRTARYGRVRSLHRFLAAVSLELWLRSRTAAS